MTPDIQAIFLDVGNTLRILLKDDLPHRVAARSELARLVGTDESPDAFVEEIDRRYKVYRKWAFEHWIEASEKELWTKWLLSEYPQEHILPISAELTFQYRQSMGRRVVADGGREVIETLYTRGYILGIISNVITEREIPEWLEADGLTKYFKSVLLSSVYGKRKPDPAIYHEAAARAGVAPSACAYVGDNPKRDVKGTRDAGFGMTIILLDPDEKDEPIEPDNQPDLMIDRLTDLLVYFPPRN
jgi:putative hydrolase of the HAD superfamily